MFLLIASFLAGMLTSLAPCILPLLPVIVGSSILNDGDKQLNRRKPYIIAASLALSVIAFTVLLKISSVLIGVDPQVWLYVSGGIVIILGVTMFFPELWLRASSKIGFEHSSNSFLSKAYKKGGLGGTIMTGAALGPVFSSCSPVYALVLATVLPVNLGLGLIYIVVYALGLGVALLAIALAGRRLTSKIQWAVNPNGTFRKVLAIILVLVGLLVITGYDKRFQTWSADHLPYGVSQLENKLLPKDSRNMAEALTETASDGQQASFNVKPYAAPELRGIVDWINSEPTTLAALKGKVVLIDFWTYSCINCQRTQPYLNTWYDKYEKDGFVILGVQAPEFAFEKVPANVRSAVKKDGIKYPVALDNDFATWNAYKNQYWPAKYLIDKDGQVRYTHFGEGDYPGTERAIQVLLKENGKQVSSGLDTTVAAVASRSGQTPETYLGADKGARFANKQQFEEDQPSSFNVVDRPATDHWSLGGDWQVSGSGSTSTEAGAVLRLNFTAKSVYLVMNGPTDQPVTLKLNGKVVTAADNGGEDVDASGQVHLNGARLYKLINLPKYSKNQLLDVTVPSGTTINALTFGG